MATLATCCESLNYRVVTATIAYTSMHAGTVASGIDLEEEFDQFEDPEFIVSYQCFTDAPYSSLLTGVIGVLLTDQEIDRLYAQRDDKAYKEICRLGANPTLSNFRIRWYDYSLSFKAVTTYLQLNYTDPRVLSLIADEKRDRFVAFRLDPERITEALTSPNDLIRRLAHWKLGKKVLDA